MKIIADATLPYLATLFPKPFELTMYHSPLELQSQLQSHNVLLCRSTLRVNQSLLAHSAIQCVATASSGTDHIDHHYLQSRHIQLFDAKGSNAAAVADYVSATLAWLEQNVTLPGKLAGVIGVGAVGSQVIRRLQAAGYDVIGYDPYQPMPNPLYEACSFEALTQCDVLCIHANLHTQAPYPSLNLIHSDFLSELKPGAAIINASRGGIVSEADLLNSTRPLHYCTDVFLAEPDINPNIIEKATLCTPHIAGHSIEAKYNAIAQLSIQLHRLLNLSPPVTRNSALESTLDVIRQSSTHDDILAIYNPYTETQILKREQDKKETFLRLRHAHTFRHDFAYYERLTSDQ